MSSKSRLVRYFITTKFELHSIDPDRSLPYHNPDSLFNAPLTFCLAVILYIDDESTIGRAMRGTRLLMTMSTALFTHWAIK